MKATIIAVARLRHRLTLLRPVTTEDSLGGRSTTYTPLAGVWGEVIPLNQHERLLGERNVHQVSHRVRIRWREGVEAGQRMTYNGRTFDVKGVYDPLSDQRWLVLDVNENNPLTTA